MIELPTIAATAKAAKTYRKMNACMYGSSCCNYYIIYDNVKPITLKYAVVSNLCFGTVYMYNEAFVV